jgi:hypothetical protein
MIESGSTPRLSHKLLCLWLAVAFALAFAVGVAAVYIGLDINKDDELCETATQGVSALVVLGGVPCNPNVMAILAHFGMYFLLIFAPLAAPTALYYAAAGVGSAVRRLRGGPAGQ